MDGSSGLLHDLDCLFWKNRRSIFVHRSENEGLCGKSTPWGEIEFGGKLDDIVPPGKTVMVAPRTNVISATQRISCIYNLSGRNIASGKARFRNDFGRIVIKEVVAGNGLPIYRKLIGQ